MRPSSSPAHVWAAWADFRADPGEATWRPFVFKLALLSPHFTGPVLGDIDPWPLTTIAEIDSADAFWSAPAGTWDD